MPILRSRAEVTLDEAVERCKAAADHYRTAQGIAHTEDLAALFRELETERRDFATSLEKEICRMGNLPSAPDADLEALEHLVTRVRMAVSPDERRALVQSCEREEEKLAAAVEVALDQDLPAETLQVLRRLEVNSARAQERLAAHHPPAPS